MAECSSCGRPIVWGKVRLTGSAVPLDPEPIVGGNIVTESERPWVRVLTGPQIAAAKKASTPTYVTHFATCPQAEHHRKGWRRRD